MKALLDTHIWLWFLLGDDRLSGTHRAIMEDDRSELFLSSISIWEMMMLVERKRVSIAGDVRSWLQSALTLLPLAEAPLTFDIEQRSQRLTLPHEDPADRSIVVTAAEMEMPLLTATPIC